SQHAGGEEVNRRAALQQQVEDRLVPHLRRRLNGCLIPRSTHVQRIGVDVKKVAHPGEVAVGVSDQLLDHSWFDLRHQRASIGLSIAASGAGVERNKLRFATGWMFEHTSSSLGQGEHLCAPSLSTNSASLVRFTICPTRSPAMVRYGSEWSRLR